MRDRKGFVLVAALWLLVALSAVGLDAALRSKARRMAAANALDESRARAAAIAGTEYARSRLTAAMLGRGEELRAQALERARNSRQRRSVQRRSMSTLFRRADPLEDPWREPQELVVPEMIFGNARYSVTVRDVGSVMNLNAADEEMLRQFFAQGLRLDFAEADRITQAILDWRDEDDLPRINGGEREEYLEEGIPFLPENRDFADLDELRNVLGMTPEIYARARPYLTLIGSGRINVNSAPEPVLLAVPGFTPASAAELLRLRESGSFPTGRSELRALLPEVARRSLEADDRRLRRYATFATDEVEILAEGRVDGSPVRVRTRVVVERTNTGAAVVWREVGG